MVPISLMAEEGQERESEPSPGVITKITSLARRNGRQKKETITAEIP